MGVFWILCYKQIDFVYWAFVGSLKPTVVHYGMDDGTDLKEFRQFQKKYVRHEGRLYV